MLKLKLLLAKKPSLKLFHKLKLNWILGIKQNLTAKCINGILYISVYVKSIK